MGNLVVGSGSGSMVADGLGPHVAPPCLVMHGSKLSVDAGGRMEIDLIGHAVDNKSHIISGKWSVVYNFSGGALTILQTVAMVPLYVHPLIVGGLSVPPTPIATTVDGCPAITLSFGGNILTDVDIDVVYHKLQTAE